MPSPVPNKWYWCSVTPNRNIASKQHQYTLYFANQQMHNTATVQVVQTTGWWYQYSRSAILWTKQIKHAGMAEPQQLDVSLAWTDMKHTHQQGSYSEESVFLLQVHHWTEPRQVQLCAHMNLICALLETSLWLEECWANRRFKQDACLLTDLFQKPPE